MAHLGDFDLSTVIDGMFTTYSTTTGAPATLGGSGVSLVVYKDNGTTQSSAGVTLTPDFDSKTGLNHFRVDTSADGTFYSTGSFFNVVIEAGVIGAVSVVGAVVASFTIRKTSALKPTTAGRTLDVSATGEAGLDWANIGSPTTAVNLSATNIDVDQVVASVSGAVGSVTGAVGSVAAGGIAAASFAAGAIDAAAIAANAIGASEVADGAIDAATFAAGAINAAAIATDAIDADALAADAVNEIWAKAIAELAQAAPSATPAVLDAIAMLYMIARNQVTVTATSKTFSNDAGTVVFKKALSDDGVTYTEAETAAGP